MESGRERGESKLEQPDDVGPTVSQRGDLGFFFIFGGGICFCLMFSGKPVGELNTGVIGSYI